MIGPVTIERQRKAWIPFLPDGDTVRDFNEYVARRRTAGSEVFQTMAQYQEELRVSAPCGGPVSTGIGATLPLGTSTVQASTLGRVGPFSSMGGSQADAESLGGALRRLGFGGIEAMQKASSLIRREAEDEASLVRLEAEAEARAERERQGAEAAERFAADFGRRLGQGQPNQQALASHSGTRASAAAGRVTGVVSVGDGDGSVATRTVFESTEVSRPRSPEARAVEGQTVPVAIAVAPVGGPEGMETSSPPRSPGGGRYGFYAVYRGLTPGIYRHWGVASLQVIGQPRNSYRGFRNLPEAIESMRAAGIDVTDDGEVVDGATGGAMADATTWHDK